MPNYRVIVDGNSGGGFLFRIEDVLTPMVGKAPFIKHEPYGLAAATSIEQLRENLRAMLAACDRPPLAFAPAQLVEVPYRKG